MLVLLLLLLQGFTVFRLLHRMLVRVDLVVMVLLLLCSGLVMVLTLLMIVVV